MLSINPSIPLQLNSFDYAKPQSTAEGWSKLAKTLISHDEEKIKDYKEDMDTLLVFVSTSRRLAAIRDFPKPGANMFSRLVFFLRSLPHFS